MLGSVIYHVSKIIDRNESTMSKDLQDKADRMIQELKDSLIPLREEIKILKGSSEEKNSRLISNILR